MAWSDWRHSDRGRPRCRLGQRGRNAAAAEPRLHR